MSFPTTGLLLSTLLTAFAFCGAAAQAADSLSTVVPFGIGPYAVACSNLTQDFTRVGAGESAQDYWNGSPSGSRQRYVSNLLSDSTNSFDIPVAIPADSDLYGRFAGAAIEVVALICYPTTANNPRPDYSLPSGTSIPHMQRG